MKALVCRELSADLNNLKLENIELPAPEPGMVKLRMHAAPTCFQDYLMVQGLYQVKPALPFTPGLEGAGEVIAIGDDVDNVKIGDAVVAGLARGLLPKRLWRLPAAFGPNPMRSAGTRHRAISPPISPPTSRFIAVQTSRPEKPFWFTALPAALALPPATSEKCLVLASSPQLQVRKNAMCSKRAASTMSWTSRKDFARP